MCHNMTNAPKTRFSKIEARGQGHSDQMTVIYTRRPQRVSTLGIPISNNIGDILRTGFF